MPRKTSGPTEPYKPVSYRFPISVIKELERIVKERGKRATKTDCLIDALMGRLPYKFSSPHANFSFVVETRHPKQISLKLHSKIIMLDDFLELLSMSSGESSDPEKEGLIRFKTEAKIKEGEKIIRALLNLFENEDEGRVLEFHFAEKYESVPTVLALTPNR